MFELIKTLTELPGMIGQEGPVQEFIRQRWQPHCQYMKTTAVGNVIAQVGGRGPRLLIEAHADEIGVLVKGISPDGFVWVAPKNDKAGRPGRDLHPLSWVILASFRQRGAWCLGFLRRCLDTSFHQRYVISAFWAGVTSLWISVPPALRRQPKGVCA